MPTSRSNKKYYQPEYLDRVNRLLKSIREALVNNTPVEMPLNLKLPFDPEISQVYITLFQPGKKSLRWGAKRADLQKSITRVIHQLKTKKRLSEFDIENPNKCRILFEMVIEEKPCRIKKLTISKFIRNRFEPGITGLKYIYDNRTHYFMPTESISKNILELKQLFNYLSKQTGHAKKTESVNERKRLMQNEPIEYHLIKSLAFISYEERAIYLYRGYPFPIKFDKTVLYETTLESMNWLLKHMNKDGSFLYYYDGIADTNVDFLHPKMKDPLYNNILRHSGALFTLFRGYEITDDYRYIEGAKKGIAFLLSTFREHTYNDKFACYPFFNKKSKLGGAGLALVALISYYMHTGDDRYRKEINGLVCHILSRVDVDGEMMGYYIHPKFQKGRPLTSLSDTEKQELFSFYYPGEALLGLAFYYRYMSNIEPKLKKEVKEKSLKALDFLIEIRPVKYAQLFTTLPADAWLMQAIEEWVKVDGFQKKAYINFVFNDAKQMIDHMYNESNIKTTTQDYLGGFYYTYGQHVYHDASRCEGIIAAYFLAKYLGRDDKANYFMDNMLKSAKSLQYTYNTPESTYSHKYPEKATGSFRFKLTRQWIRVDSIQHTACFYARLYNVME